MMESVDYNKTLSLFKQIWKDILTPPPDLTVSEWADNYRKLSSEGSAEPGQWRTSRAPYQKEIMDSINDPEIEKVIIMASAQVGKTEFLLNMVGYHIDYDPAPILLLQPTDALAKSFSKQRLAPMIRDTPAIRNKVADVKTRNGGNTTLEKSFPGGYIALVGANAPSGLAGRPIRILLADEVDRFPISAGTEGDPLSLAEKRTNNFYNRKKVFVSTPTIKGKSRIEAEFNGSTKEYYHLPCPSCEHLQPLNWGQIVFDKNDLSKPVEHACKDCGSIHNEHEWKSQKGVWIASEPNAPYRGFHLNELVSPWRKWREIVEDFLDAKRKGPELMKVWVNTSLGETWEEDEGEHVDEDKLLDRREDYDAEVPEGVKILTAAVDVQDDRFEIEVVGWGVGRESWGIEYHVLYGDLKQERVWNELDAYLQKTWTKSDGRAFGIACTCIDSGGHFTQEVYRFVKNKEARRVYAIKGASVKKGEHVPLISGTSRPKPIKALLVTLGVNDGKNRVMSNLNVEDFGPNYCHFPKGRNYEAAYFKSLTAEKLVTRYEKGIPYQTWVKVRARNEAFDLRVYNTAAIEILNPNFNKEYPMVASSSKNRRGRPRRRRR